MYMCTIMATGGWIIILGIQQRPDLTRTGLSLYQCQDLHIKYRNRNDSHCCCGRLKVNDIAYHEFVLNDLAAG